MWNAAFWLEQIVTWAVVLAVPAWLVIEEVVHRLPARTESVGARSSRPGARPSRAAQPTVVAGETARA